MVTFIIPIIIRISEARLTVIGSGNHVRTYSGVSANIYIRQLKILIFIYIVTEIYFWVQLVQIKVRVYIWKNNTQLLKVIYNCYKQKRTEILNEKYNNYKKYLTQRLSSARDKKIDSYNKLWTQSAESDRCINGCSYVVVMTLWISFCFIVCLVYSV